MLANPNPCRSRWRRRSGIPSPRHHSLGGTRAKVEAIRLFGFTDSAENITPVLRSIGDRPIVVCPRPHSLTRAAGLISHVHALFHPPTPGAPIRALYPWRGTSDSLYFLLEGVAEAALYCAHRTTYMLPPSSLFISQGWGLIDLPLRASNEGLLRPRVARAQKIIRLHPVLCSASKKGTWPLLLILPLQSAVEGVPREGARFLSPDCGGSYGTDDLDCHITLNSSNW
jgi:hypothetical protein